MKKRSDYVFTGILVVFYFMMQMGFADVIKNKTMHINQMVRTQFIEEIVIGKDVKIFFNESNMNNGGYTLETNEHYYVVHDHNNLRRSDKAYKNEESVDLKKQRYGIGRMQIVGDWLFYTAHGISRIKLDGTQEKELFPAWVLDVYVTPEWIYFLNSKDNLRLYRMDVNGRQLECINKDSFRDLLFVDDMMYGTVENDRYNDLVAMDMEGNITKVIKKGISAGGMIKKDDFIYYRDMNNMYLYRWNLNENRPEMVVAKEINYFAMDEKYIFYTERDTSNDYGDSIGLFRFDERSNETTMLDNKTSTSTGSIHMLGDEVFIESDYKVEPFGILRIKKDGSKRILIK